MASVESAWSQVERLFCARVLSADCPLTLVIDSFGGSARGERLLIDILRELPCPIVAKIYKAQSAAFDIALVADRRIAAAKATLTAHVGEYSVAPIYLVRFINDRAEPDEKHRQAYRESARMRRRELAGLLRSAGVRLSFAHRRQLLTTGLLELPVEEWLRYGVVHEIV